MELKCYHRLKNKGYKKCGHVWNYKGKLPYATCPSCLLKVEVENAKKE